MRRLHHLIALSAASGGALERGLEAICHGQAHPTKSGNCGTKARHAGAAALPAGPLTILKLPATAPPIVAGAQTHGLAIFHAADDRKVMVVQTGSNLPQASGLHYYLLLR